MSAPDASDHSPSVDVRVPSTARVYDYLLGGKDNFPADRAVAEQLIAGSPDAMEQARANRKFVQAAVRLAAEGGIRQFVDLGTGIPTSPNVHEIARSIQPDARIVYADNDPVVSAHNRAWRAGSDRVVCIEADIREPGQVLTHPEVTELIDPAEPVAVIMAAVLHFTENADAIIAAFREWMSPGSLLVISVATRVGMPEDKRAPFSDAYKNSSIQLILRSRAEVEALFDGFEMLEPGLEEPARWRNPSGKSFPFKALAGVARRP